MNNALLFFFNININDIKKINKDYYFNYLDNNYIVSLYKRGEHEVLEIYYLNLELLNKGLNGYEIILTKDMEILFSFESNYYILMKIPNIENRLINYDDIIKFEYYPINKFKHLDKSNWGDNWSNKIDFIEYQFSQVKNKYPIINNSIDYFIGIFENAISYYNDNTNFNKNKGIAHKRLSSKTDLLEFYNPLNFVIDYKERDVADYLKSYVFNNNCSFEVIDKFLNNFNRESIILIISRLLFPSYYFDLYENIILENVKEESIKDSIKKSNDILYIIKYTFIKYSNYNIPSIEWIKKEISH